MLDRIFAAATGRAALVALAVLLASSYAIKNFSPKSDLARDLGPAYVSTDNPPETEGALWYDAARLTDMLRLYEPRHYDAHESFILLWDLLYPPLYAIPSVLLLAYLCPWRGGGGRRLVLLPLAVMAFDYCENFTMLALLRLSRVNRQASPALLELSRACTVAKLLLLLTLFALLVAFLVAFAVRRLRARPAAR